MPRETAGAPRSRGTARCPKRPRETAGCVAATCRASVALLLSRAASCDGEPCRAVARGPSPRAYSLASLVALPPLPLANHFDPRTPFCPFPLTLLENHRDCCPALHRC